MKKALVKNSGYFRARWNYEAPKSVPGGRDTQYLSGQARE